MYQLDQIRVLEIETINNCNAACPQCMRTNHETLAPTFFNDTINWPQIMRNIPKNFWGQLKTINFNGTSGDNCLHNDIKKIVIDISLLAQQATIRICTNGSLRTPVWWEDFGSSTKNTNVEVVFGIDGLSDTHSLYRVGTNWDKIIENASAFIAGGGRAIWQMILFDHNLHQIEQCRTLANDLGFASFYLRSENRFKPGQQEQTVFWQGQATHTIKPPNVDKLKEIAQNYNIFQNWGGSTTKTHKEIHCRSIDKKWLAIYADGTVWPCCFLMGYHKAKHLKQFKLVNYHFKKILSIDFDQINLYNNKLEDIVASDLWQKRYPQSFKETPNLVCTYTCSK